jgi:hypothetical protein
MISGGPVVTYTDGTEETCVGNDLFYWPPGHSVRVVMITPSLCGMPSLAARPVS